MKDPLSPRHYLVWVVALVVLFAAGTLTAADKQKGANQSKSNPTLPTPVAGAKYVGSEQCKACHEDQVKTMQATPHYRIAEPRKNAEAEGCETCHGPGSLHIDAGGDKSKILRFPDLKTDEGSALCMTCHSQGKDQQHFERSVHLRSGVGCTTCHSPHHAKAEHMLSQKQPTLCFTCHAETKADFMKPFHHRVVEGYVTCSDCHNVHGTTTEKQLRNTASQEAACFKCHSDLRGPFVFEHEPVKSEGCATCHNPHGSANPRLLKTARVNSMCLQCHQNFYNAPHPQNTKSQACTMCHTAVHGSNTSSYLFKR
jgi:DmsE family decaheme c-type cytochrome